MSLYSSSRIGYCFCTRTISYTFLTMEQLKITAGKKDEEIHPLTHFTGWCRPPTDGEVPLDPKQGWKVADVDLEITGEGVGVGTAAADTGTPSDEGAGRSGSSATKLFCCLYPLVGPFLSPIMQHTLKRR